MIFYYGTQSKRLKDGRIKNAHCTNCNIETDMIFSLYGKYAHLYLIPLFPIKKIVAVECVNCKMTSDLKSQSEPVKRKFQQQEIASPTKHPFWFYSGTTIIAAIAILITFTSMQSAEDEKIYIANPKVGDIYHLQLSEGHYTSGKVSKVLKGSLYLFLNDMETTVSYGIDEINLEKYYNNQHVVARKKLVEMYNEETIFQIDREE